MPRDSQKSTKSQLLSSRPLAARLSPEQQKRFLRLLACLFVSGACALIFQVVWMREFRLIFGSTTASSAVVIAIFMGGLGIGNAFWGSRLERSSRPLATYAGLELGIAAAAFVSPLLLAIAQSVYWSLGGVAALGQTSAFVIRLLLSIVVLGLPTFLMGGTLPAVAKVLVRTDDTQRRAIAWLYAFNTLGAVCGTIAATFWMLEAIGARSTLLFAVGLNSLVAFFAWRLSKGESTERRDKGAPANDPNLPTAEELPLRSWVIPTQLYSIAFLVGAIFFVMEMIWFRMLGPLLGGTTYTFGLILAVALAGIGLGGALYSWAAQRSRLSFAWLAATCSLEALLIALPLFLGDRIAFWLLETQRATVESFGQQIAIWAQVAVIVVGLPSLIAGFQFPLLLGLVGQGDRHVARQVGWICAANTTGAITGSLLGGLLLLPALGAVGLWKLAVVVLVVMAVLIALLQLSKSSLASLSMAGSVLVGCGLFAVLALFSTGPTALWRHSGIGAGRADFDGTSWNERRNYSNSVQRQLCWEVEGWEASVAVTANDSMSLVVNGKSDGNAIADVATQIGLGILGPLLHDRCDRGLVVGLGTGESAGWLAQVSGVAQVDVVEMEFATERVARECASLNGDVMNRDNVRLYYNDAREFLMTTTERYDVIVSEPSNPYRAGIANLYTRDFYTAVSQRLETDGLFLQWLQGYEVDDRTVRMVLRTLLEVFPHLQVWATSPGDMVIVCSQRDLASELTGEMLRSRMQEPALEEALRKAWRVTDLEGLAARWLGNEVSLSDWLGQGESEINTDDCNLLEYAFAKTVGKRARFVSTSLRTEGLRTTLSHALAWKELDPSTVSRREQVMRSWFSQGATVLESQARDPLTATLRAYFGGDYQAAINGWKNLGDSACPIEALMRSHSLAETGAELPPEILERVERTHAIEADVMRTIVALKRNRRDVAWQHLETALKRLQQDPWGDGRLLIELFAMAAEMPRWNEERVSDLELLLREPYSIRRMDESRRMVRLIVSESLGPEVQLAAFADVEPYVPWRDWLLKTRAELYSEHRPEFAERADREWDQFLESQ